jgi:probable F420-dependent oxidoreductase
MKIGKLAVWALTNEFTAPAAAAFAQRVEAWGYSTLWIPEAIGRDPLTGSSWLLANTEKLQLATGIANIYARDAYATLNAQYGLNEQSGGRFLLGLGVSHAPLVEGLRGHVMQKPIPAMRSYLEAMAAHEYKSPPPPEKPKTILAALGPRMLELARTHADGAHPYNVSPVHTAMARKILGPGKWLCPEQKVVLETDPAKARAVGRRTLGFSLHLPNYRNNFLRMGFTEDDLAGNGSDRWVDALVAWGDEDAIRRRIQEHLDAGADQVCIQSLAKGEKLGLTADDEKIFELLAPGQD